MKNQLWKISLFGMIVLGIVACTPTENILDENLFTGEAESVSASELPATAADFLSANFPNLGIESVDKITTSEGEILFSAILEDGTEYTFEARGGRCDTISIDSLPQAVHDYLDTNFPEEAILRASQMETKDGEARFVVKLTSGEILAFDENGNLQATKMRGRKKRHKRHGTPVEPDSLSSAIQTYMTTNHPNETILKAFSITTSDGTIVYGVVLGRRNVLFFDENGNLLEDFRPKWRN